MACGGILSPVMAIAGTGLLSNTGLGVNGLVTQNLGSFNSLPITNQFSNIVTQAAGGLVNDSTLQSLRTLGAATFPALTNAIPSSVTGVLGSVANGGFTGLINTTATGLMGGGDLGKFGQVFSAAQAYVGQANQFVGAALNAGSLDTTFSSLNGGMNNIITGGFSTVTQAFGDFGGDLTKLGSMIDMNNLPNLGNPTALVARIGELSGGEIPALSQILSNAGLNPSSINDLTAGVSQLGAAGEKLVYDAMTRVTGAELTQIKNVLGVTTPGINNMAQLLDPAKILPNSYQTLTMPSVNGLQPIYTAANTVNTSLERFLQDPNAPVYTGDDPIVRARLGLPPTPTARA